VSSCRWSLPPDPLGPSSSSSAKSTGVDFILVKTKRLGRGRGSGGGEVGRTPPVGTSLRWKFSCGICRGHTRIAAQPTACQSAPPTHLSPTPHQAVWCNEVEPRCIVEEVHAAGAIEVGKACGLVRKEGLSWTYRWVGGVGHTPCTVRSNSTTRQLQPRPPHAPRPPHLRRLPKVVTLHVSIFCEVALMARWISDESGSSG